MKNKKNKKRKRVNKRFEEKIQEMRDKTKKTTKQQDGSDVRVEVETKIGRWRKNVRGTEEKEERSRR